MQQIPLPDFTVPKTFASTTTPSGTAACITPESPYMTAIRCLLRVSRRQHACVERRISDLGIHHSQHRMLFHLAGCDHAPSQKEIAESMGISPAAVATTLKKLEKEGYITRSATNDDNRRNDISITETGLIKVTEGWKIFEAIDRQLFAGFTPQDVITLVQLLEAMDRNLDAAGAPVDAHPASQE